MRDSIINQIEATSSKELAPARQLVHRIWKRDLYKCVHQEILQCDERDGKASHQRIWEMSSDEIEEAICSVQGYHDGAVGSSISRDDIIIDKCQVHHGLKEQDPVSRIRFLAKDDINQLSKKNYLDLPTACDVEQWRYESFLPKKLMQRSLRVFSRDSSEEKCDLMRHQFEQWWEWMKACNEQIKMTDGPDILEDSMPNMLTQEDSDGDEVQMLSPQQGIIQGSFPETPMNVTPVKGNPATSEL